MEDVYYNPSDPGSFGGIKRLKERYKKKRKDVRKWLTFQDTYTLHKPVRKSFPRRRVLVHGIYDQWQIDLVDLSSLSRVNDNYKFLLTCIDVLSKYAWVVPMKDKSAKSLVDAVAYIFTTSKRMPNKIQGDKGKEFVNRKFKSFLKDHRVHFFSTENDDIKASVVERFNRTLKSKMWRYFTYTRKKRYVDTLDALVLSYNNSKHRTIRMSPSDVTSDDELTLLRDMHNIPVPREPKQSFRVGDSVRIAMTRRPFKKGYTGQWSEELFVVSEKLRTIPTTYRVKDLVDEQIDGTFYHQELQLVRVEQDKVYTVERILKKRKRGKKIEYFVKWKGYGDKFNTWIIKEDVIA